MSATQHASFLLAVPLLLLNVNNNHLLFSKAETIILYNASIYISDDNEPNKMSWADAVAYDDVDGRILNVSQSSTHLLETYASQTSTIIRAFDLEGKVVLPGFRHVRSNNFNHTIWNKTREKFIDGALIEEESYESLLHDLEMFAENGITSVGCMQQQQEKQVWERVEEDGLMTVRLFEFDNNVTMKMYRSGYGDAFSPLSKIQTALNHTGDESLTRSRVEDVISDTTNTGLLLMLSSNSRTGVVREGFKADLVILDTDIFNFDSANILTTIFGGRVVYDPNGVIVNGLDVTRVAKKTGGGGKTFFKNKNRNRNRNNNNKNSTNAACHHNHHGMMVSPLLSSIALMGVMFVP